MYKRILVTVDGSETSNQALVAALQLGRDLQAKVRLVHVVEELTLLSGYEPMGAYSENVVQALREGGTQVLDDALAIAKAAGVDTDTCLFETLGERLGEVVAKAALAWGADLIVTGTHGRHGVGRVLLGSGAEQIIRAAPVPVLVVRGHQGARGEGGNEEVR